MKIKEFYFWFALAVGFVFSVYVLVDLFVFQGMIKLIDYWNSDVFSHADVIYSAGNMLLAVPACGCILICTAYVCGVINGSSDSSGGDL